MAFLPEIIVCVGLACNMMADSSTPDGYPTEAECKAKLGEMSKDLPDALAAIFGHPVERNKLKVAGRCRDLSAPEPGQRDL